MKKNVYILLSILFLFACSTESDPIDPDKPDPEIPGVIPPDPDPKDPEYDKDTQVLIGGLVWDKYSAVDYCSFTEAEAEAKKKGKRIPTRDEWESLIDLGYTWDSVLLGYWYGVDSEKLDQSEKSIFLKAAGYYMPDYDKVNSKGLRGEFWSYDNKKDGEYYVVYSNVEVTEYSPIRFSGLKNKNTHISAHFVKD